jgi:hypothetical protein
MRIQAMIAVDGLILAFIAVSAALVIASRRPPQAGRHPSASPPVGEQPPMFGQRVRPMTYHAALAT